MEITQLRTTPIIRSKSNPLPQIVFTSEDDDDEKYYVNSSPSDEEIYDTESLFSDGNEIILPEMENSVPEVTYGLKPRMAWMYR